MPNFAVNGGLVLLHSCLTCFALVIAADTGPGLKACRRMSGKHGPKATPKSGNLFCPAVHLQDDPVFVGFNFYLAGEGVVEDDDEVDDQTDEGAEQTVY